MKNYKLIFGAILALLFILLGLVIYLCICNFKSLLRREKMITHLDCKIDGNIRYFSPKILVTNKHVYKLNLNKHKDNCYILDLKGKYYYKDYNLNDIINVISFDKEILWANYCEISKKDYFYNYCNQKMQKEIYNNPYNYLYEVKYKNYSKEDFNKHHIVMDKEEIKVINLTKINKDEKNTFKYRGLIYKEEVDKITNNLNLEKIDLIYQNRLDRKEKYLIISNDKVYKVIKNKKGYQLKEDSYYNNKKIKALNYGVYNYRDGEFYLNKNNNIYFRKIFQLT